MDTDYTSNLNSSYVKKLFLSNLLEFGYLVLPFLVISVIGAIMANLIQTGFIYTNEPLKPDFKRLNPIEGFKNIFSKKSFLTLMKNFLKLILVFYIVYKCLSRSINIILNSGNLGSRKLFNFTVDLIKDIGMDVGLIILIIAIVDYIFQRRDHRKNLRMSKQEIKDEYKEMEGSPEIKSARRQRQRQLAMGRMMESIKEATVVITNPTHIAVVLRYHNGKDKVPVLTAKGADYIAQKIKNMAKENNIPIMENKELARTMYRDVEIGEQVPVELYKAVAEILAIVYQMREKNKNKI